MGKKKKEVGELLMIWHVASESGNPITQEAAMHREGWLIYG